MSTIKYKTVTIPFFCLSNKQDWSDWYHYTWLPLCTTPHADWPEYSLHLPCLTDSGYLYGYFGLAKKEVESVFQEKCLDVGPLESPKPIYLILEKVKELTEKNYDVYFKDPQNFLHDVRELILEHKTLFEVCSFYKSIGRLVIPGVIK